MFFLNRISKVSCQRRVLSVEQKKLLFCEGVLFSHHLEQVLEKGNKEKNRHETSPCYVNNFSVALVKQPMYAFPVTMLHFHESVTSAIKAGRAL